MRRRTLAVMFASIAIIGCGNEVDIPVIVNPVDERFSSDHDLEDLSIQPYMVDGIFVVPIFGAVADEEFEIGIEAFSRTGSNTVAVTSIQIEGIGSVFEGLARLHPTELFGDTGLYREHLFLGNRVSISELAEVERRVGGLAVTLQVDTQPLPKKIRYELRLEWRRVAVPLH